CADAIRAVYSAGTDLAAARQRNGDVLQEGVSAIDVDRLGGSHHGGELGIGEANWHGGPHHRLAQCPMPALPWRARSGARGEGLRSLTAAGPFVQAHIRGPRSSEDSEMFTHAACLLLRREFLGALAKPTETARPLARPFFGWPRGTIWLESV